MVKPRSRDVINSILSSSKSARKRGKGADNSVGWEIRRFSREKRVWVETPVDWNWTSTSEELEKDPRQEAATVFGHQYNHRVSGRLFRDIDGTEIANKHICRAVASSNRKQSHYVHKCLFVQNAQIRLFEEGLHIADVKETIEQNVVATNHKLIIDTIIEDICHSDDSSWRKRLASPTRKLNKARAGCNDSSSSPSTSSMALSWNQNESAYYGTMSSVGSSRPQTLSSATADGSLTARRAPISAQTFVPPTGTPFVNSPSSEFAKPPLPRRLNEPEVYDNGNKTSVFTLSSNSMSVSSNDIHDQRRPISFNGDDSGIFWRDVCLIVTIFRFQTSGDAFLERANKPSRWQI